MRKDRINELDMRSSKRCGGCYRGRWVRISKFVLSALSTPSSAFADSSRVLEGRVGSLCDTNWSVVLCR